MSEFIDDLLSRVLRIEQSLQIGDCPPIEGCAPHADIEEVDKHTPKLHATVGEHSDGGRDPLTNLARQATDIEVQKPQPRVILDSGLGTTPERWSIAVTDAGAYRVEYWDETGGQWIATATIDSAGGVAVEGALSAVGTVKAAGSPAVFHMVRDDGVEYRFAGAASSLLIQSRPTSGDAWTNLMTLPLAGLPKGTLLAANADGSLEGLGPGANGLGLAADDAAALGLVWSNFGSPTAQLPGIVPLSGVIPMPVLGGADPGLQPDNSRYVIADGRSLLSTTYPDLFAILGYTYGGSGSSFNLPDMQDALVVGVKPVDRPEGATGGSWDHDHSLPDVPEHTHVLTDPGHDHGVADSGHSHGVTDPGHRHDLETNGQTGSGTGDTRVFNPGTETPGYISSEQTGISIQSANAGVSVSANTSGITIASAGAPGARAAAATIDPPYVAMYWCMRIE